MNAQSNPGIVLDVNHPTSIGETEQTPPALGGDIEGRAATHAPDIRRVGSRQPSLELDDFGFVTEAPVRHRFPGDDPCEPTAGKPGCGPAGGNGHRQGHQRKNRGARADWLPTTLFIVNSFLLMMARFSSPRHSKQILPPDIRVPRLSDWVPVLSSSGSSGWHLDTDLPCVSRCAAGCERFETPLAFGLHRTILAGELDSPRPFSRVPHELLSSSDLAQWTLRRSQESWAHAA